MDEREAIARLRQGDIDGLETLVRKYQVQAMRAAYLITGDRAMAEDIVQEAFLRAYERIGQLQSGRPFSPWFFRSVVNDAIKATTRHRHQVYWANGMDEDSEEGLMLDERIADSHPGPEELLERIELSEVVGEALKGLSFQRRAAIVLRYYLDLTEPEIASRLQWPLGTVKRRLHDARNHLRALIAPASPRQGQGITPRQSSEAEPGCVVSEPEIKAVGGKS